MIKRFASNAVILSALLVTGATVSIQSVLAQSASSVTLELFNTKPSGSGQATASLEIGSGGGNLQGIETPEKAGKARYLRAKVSSASGTENYLYRVIGNPNNGRIFIITPERKAIALNKFLASTGLEVGADKTVKLGSQVDFASTNATVMESGSSASQVAGSTTEVNTTSSTASTAPVSTTATDSSTTGSTPADATPTTTATDSSTATPAEPSAATTEASTTPATTATPEASTASTSSSTTPATDANAAPATPVADATTATPATDANAAAPASSAATTEATALTAPVTTTVGTVELTVIPAGATAPASSEKNLILAPVADATDAKSRVEGNTVTLSYTSSSSIDAVSKFYDDQLKAQGFTPDTASAANQQSADQFVKVYKRGTASMTMTLKNENGVYQVEVDLEGLASGN